MQSLKSPNAALLLSSLLWKYPDRVGRVVAGEDPSFEDQSLERLDRAGQDKRNARGLRLEGGFPLEELGRETSRC